jgi:hypothetical protein
MVEVEVQNFQSIEKASLKVEGFTALVGRSNIGKSALLRAVKAALTGAPVSSFVRHQKNCQRRTKRQKVCSCFTSVRLKMPDFDLLWEKGDTRNRYTFNGVIYDKASSGPPDFLPPSFLPVKLADKTELLQVADQFSPIFLLNQSGGAVADMLSDVARLDRINVAIRNVEKDRKEASSTRKVREKDIVDLTAKLDKFSALDATAALVSEVQARLDALNLLSQQVAQVDDYVLRGSVVATRIKHLQKTEAVVVPDSTLVVGQLDSFAQLTGWGRQHLSLDGLVVKLVPVEEIQLVLPLLVKQHSDSLKQLDQLTEWSRQNLSLEVTVSKLAPVEEIQLVPPLLVRENSDTLKRLVSWYGQLINFRDWFNKTKPVEALPPLSAPPLQNELAQLGLVTQYTHGIQNIQNEIDTLEQAYAEALTEAEKAHEEVEALGVCPTCVRPWSPDPT